jgi:hypothetical protein
MSCLFNILHTDMTSFQMRNFQAISDSLWSLFARHILMSTVQYRNQNDIVLLQEAEIL